LIVVGLVFLLASRWNLPLGRLPGDFSHEGKNVRVYFPLGTSLLLSVIISLILYLIGRFRQ
jgi:Protein of unknown function (DUF2905)